MVALRRSESGGGLYDRLLRRLGLALAEVDGVSHLQQELPAELELRGLSASELQLIRAYLDRDLKWLQGWHAAAQEVAMLEQQPTLAGKPGRIGSKPALRGKPLAKRRQALCCALCSTPVNWQRGHGVQACSACGSQLFRAGHPGRG